MGSGCENRKEKVGDTEIEFCPGLNSKIGLYTHPISGFVVEFHYQSLQIRSRYSNDLPFSKI